MAVTHSNYLHQIDVVGPRYLKEEERFYSVNIIDAFGRRNSSNPERRQNRIAVNKKIYFFIINQEIKIVLQPGVPLTIFL